MRTVTFTLIALASLVLIPAVQQASATTLATTVYALNAPGIPGGVWKGTQDYNAFSVDTTIEFAVFAPGDFQNFLDDNNIVYSDPAPSEYIYAYQVVDIGPGTSVVTFTVGLQEDEDLGSTGVWYIPASTDYGVTYPYVPTKDPADTTGGPGVGDSSAWQALPSFGTGEFSPILYYSSPQVPELGYSVAANILGQQIEDSMPNPSTIPEPATLALCIVAGLGLVTRRRL